MGLDIDAWYGSSWSPPAPPAVIAESESSFSPQETFETWHARARALVVRNISKRAGGALVLGRFHPPHLGHAFLMQRAEQAVEGPLLVYVVGKQDDRLPLETRQTLVQGLITRAGSHVKLARDVPITGSPDQPGFWQAWADWLRSRNLPPEIRTLVASDPKAQALATLLKLDFSLVDPERRNVPVSATMIRKAPWEHWPFIHPQVRPLFTCSVVLLGPEGAGKTALAKKLASHYSIARAPEFAAYWSSKNLGKTPGLQDFQELAEGQRRLLEDAKQNTRRFYVADTDLISLMLWKQRLYGVEDRSLVPPQTLGDLYLVLEDAPWTGPAQRDDLPARQAFVQSCMDAVRAQGRTPVLISGPRESRFAAAVEAIDSWRKTHPAAWER